MRDKNHTSFMKFEEQIKKFVRKNFQESLFLKNPVVDSPTFLKDITIVYPRKFNEIENLVLLHWHLPETLRWKIWLDLDERKFSNFNKKQRIILKIILSSEKNCYRYFYETERLSSHEFWGKLGQATRIQLPNFLEKYVIVRPKRKRGYDDKGSSRPKDKWLPSHDFSFTEIQNHKEYEEYLQNKIITRILRNFENCN